MTKYYVFSANAGIELIGDKRYMGVSLRDHNGIYCTNNASICAALILVEDLDETVKILLALKAAVFKEVAADMFSGWLTMCIHRNRQWRYPC